MSGEMRFEYLIDPLAISVVLLVHHRAWITPAPNADLPTAPPHAGGPPSRDASTHADGCSCVQVCVLGTLAFSIVIFIAQTAVAERRALLEAREASARRLHHIGGGAVATPSLAAGLSYHLFLSHVWSSGQDVVRVIKERLSEMLPI
jgi:hypothetical protein